MGEPGGKFEGRSEPSEPLRDGSQNSFFVLSQGEVTREDAVANHSIRCSRRLSFIVRSPAIQHSARFAINEQDVALF